MKISIITIGDEILLGQTVDTNSAWIGATFRDLGVKVHSIWSVADDREEIIRAVENGIAQNQVLLLTGGLGPTKDDITKNTLMEIFGSKPVFHEDIWEIMVKIFQARGREVLEMNRSQATYPDNCQLLRNQKGTAQGMWFEKDGCIVISLPGVPYEMKHIMETQAIPKLMERFEFAGIRYRVLMTAGVGESQVAARLEAFEQQLPPQIRLAYLPEPGVVKLRLTAYGDVPESELERCTAEMKSTLGDWCFSDREESLEKFLQRTFIENNWKLSVAESCTGGYLSHLITAIPGSSTYFEGGAVVYSYALKSAILGVKPETLEKYGAVSEPTVLEMAEGMKSFAKTTYSISISGIAGPGGATPDKPVGTVWIAVAGPGPTVAKMFKFYPGRIENIRVFAIAALNTLRLTIQRDRSAGT